MIKLSFILQWKTQISFCLEAKMIGSHASKKMRPKWLGLENILLQNLLFCKLQSVQYLNRVYILVIIIIFFFMQKIQGTQIMVKYHKGIRFIAKGYVKISRK